MKIRVHSKENAIYIMVIVLSVVVFSYRNLFGFDWSDETFYSTESYRLLIGDKLFENSWWYSMQFTNVFLYPLVAIYHAIVGNMDGIMVAFRIIYTAINAMVAFIAYCAFHRKAGNVFATCISLLIIVYASSGIASLSYNTIFLHFSIIALILLYVNSKWNNKWHCVLSGLFFAFAVQCYPTTVILVPVMVLYIFLSTFNKRDKISSIMWWLLGCIIVVLLFMSFIMYNSSFNALIQNIENMFDTGAAVHSNWSIKSLIFAPISLCTEIYRAIGALCALLICVFFILSLYKPIRKIMFIMNLLLVFVIVHCIEPFFEINSWTLPLLLVAPALFICSRERCVSTVMIYMYGIVAALSMFMGSNTGLNAVSAPLLICNIAVILLLSRNVPVLIISKKEISSGKIKELISAIVALSICLMLIVGIGVDRFSYVYRDNDISACNTRLSGGPGSGLYTTAEGAKRYQSVLKDINTFVKDKETVLFTQLLPWGYLCTDARPATPKLWRTRIDDEILAKYYTMHPELLPECVYIINEEYYSQYQGDVYYHIISDNPVQGYLGELLISNSYEMIKTEYATVYMRVGE